LNCDELLTQYSFLRVEHVLHGDELPFAVPPEGGIRPDEGSLKIFTVRPGASGGFAAVDYG
jgi:hypothetical protein